jgi:hypothetical protein
MVTQFSRSDCATQFYQTYYLQLMQEILAVMTGEAAWFPPNVYSCIDISWRQYLQQLISGHDG